MIKVRLVFTGHLNNEGFASEMEIFEDKMSILDFVDMVTGHTFKNPPGYMIKVNGEHPVSSYNIKNRDIIKITSARIRH